MWRNEPPARLNTEFNTAPPSILSGVARNGCCPPVYDVNRVGTKKRPAAMRWGRQETQTAPLNVRGVRYRRAKTAERRRRCLLLAEVFESAIGHDAAAHPDSLTKAPVYLCTGRRRKNEKTGHRRCVGTINRHGQLPPVLIKLNAVNGRHRPRRRRSA